MAFPVVPVVVGAGALGLGAVLLRLRALAIAAKNKIVVRPVENIPSPPSPAPVGPVVTASPPVVSAPLPVLIANPDGSPHTQGTPFVFDTNADAVSAVDEANSRGISVHELLLEKSGQLEQTGDGIAALGQKAVVTTNDPPPSGDLIVRGSPSTSATQIGGVDKNGTVIILDSSDPVFAKIQWAGGRWPAVTGFSKKQFLKLI